MMQPMRSGDRKGLADAYRAVWFDAGDTLVTIPDTEKMFVSFLAERSIEVPEERIAQALNKAFTHIYYGHRPDRYEACTPESDRRYWVRFYEYVLEELNLSRGRNEGEIRAMCHELYELYISPRPYVLFEDVAPVLEHLSASGKRMAVVSNFAPTLLQILEDKGIARHFEAVVVSTLVGYEKPDPRIFRYALEVTGLDPSEVLYVGDHEVNDIWASAQVGIRSVRIKRYGYQQGTGIASLTELL